MLHVLGRNSRAVIPHLDGEQPTGGARDQLHLGRSPVLRGIGEQIVERAAQHHAVDFNLSAAAAVLHAQRRAGMAGAEPEGGLLHHLRRRRALQPQRGLRRGKLEAGAGEDVVGQPFQLGKVPRDARQLRGGVLRAALRREIERDADARERRAQLVRDVREKLALAMHQVLDPFRHLVERDGDVAQFVAAAQLRARPELARAQPPPRSPAAARARRVAPAAHRGRSRARRSPRPGSASERRAAEAIAGPPRARWRAWPRAPRSARDRCRRCAGPGGRRETHREHSPAALGGERGKQTFTMQRDSLSVRGARKGRAEWCEDDGPVPHLVDVALMAAARILIVEDFADSRDMYVEFLQAQGFQVAAAEDGIAALRSIEAAIPDLVVLDVALPKLDGLSVLRRLRADPRFASLPVLTLSASLGADYQRIAMEAGATAALEKPCLPEELLTAVQQALGRA